MIKKGQKPVNKRLDTGIPQASGRTKMISFINTPKITSPHQTHRVHMYEVKANEPFKRESLVKYSPSTARATLAERPIMIFVVNVTAGAVFGDVQ